MRRGRFLTVCLLLGYAFLYVPVLLLVATSFNPNRLTTVLSGFSLRWYAALWANDKLIEAALLSLRIAAVSATGATVLGTLAGFAPWRGLDASAGGAPSPRCCRRGWCCRTCWSACRCCCCSCRWSNTSAGPRAAAR